MRQTTYQLAAAAVVLVLLGLAGCNGGGNGAAAPTRPASAAVTIHWPAAAAFTRLIPAAAQSIKVALSDGNGFAASQTVNRPAAGTTSTLTFVNLPVGTLSVTATAYPQSGAAGTPLASGVSSVATTAGQQATLSLTMASTIDRLEITSPGLSLPAGGTLQLTATPKDAAGNTVLVSAGNLGWTSSSAAATVGQATGLVTGVSAGTAILTVTESESQLSASVTVTVTAGNTAPTASFTVTPASGTTATNFTFDASGSNDTQDVAAALQVSWDWTNAGVWTAYTTTKTAAHAFASAGTYTVALRVKDSGGMTATATKTVTVTADNGPKLTLSLDTSLNSGGTSKATAITKAELLDTGGAVAATATIGGGAAQFPLTGLAAGTYFIRVNDLADNLLPTRLDNPAAGVTQFVGNQLNLSVIGTLADPTYKIKVFPKGQGAHTVIGYSGAATASYSYVILLMKASPQQVESRVLGTGALLTTHTHANHNFSTFIIGSANHGAKTGSCSGCHGSLSAKPATYASIIQEDGWCYKCHYGPTGPAAGMVDPAK